ncbi:hypothetical protein HJC23_006833 [Cyclotella cryptica]|uniref:ABM domain-containing protein n=1 Tax=Cyclotella cryptica TaxID=29204 RepID=A0ABD3PFG2_9STRA
MKIAPLLLPLLTSVNAFAPQKTTLPSRAFSSSSLSAMPICIVVEAEIKEDRMDEFLDIIEKNAVASRQEPGCIRFDVLHSEDTPNKFFFYEVYENADAISHHKTQPHYLAWGEFKESGGTVSSVTKKASGKFMT